MQMKRHQRWLMRCLAMGIMVVAVAITGPTQAASGNGPYYATPSWDQKLPCYTTLACPRFVVLTDWNSEAVLDRETGLVWEKSPNLNPVSWRDARFCIDKKVAGRLGWRLPSIAELTSLIDGLNAAPAFPFGHPFGDLAGFIYWSATTNRNNPNEAWQVDFTIGAAILTNKSLSSAAWCVRGGMNADQY